ncbi:glycosyltransferase family 4 protein [Dolichospermum sp. ST_sed1]|nr:glycosyltransferase family 4 protein [Dolichospermum sp. ST_sed1]MDD1424652.1 glycosyltransferase family 4 protein [Dolichospermum sp. ST_sed9]MDD1432752.1 glycosyltransferase family 4 protein [Dolichospermum sp. ST_sed6]MDD1436831.1 glycosyltransferase family 4 protein [Dolichospermum sp. ST_sed10]MDD1439690.1 glycosyltransferase family 4 protein [Dolichospermum sp. ST_sed3]MDD1446961.1 glycosyltransferase family 4 protein [Dolichospermum sp. ST_sed8]MDD1455321.1 glycosyltransferase famil
MVNNAAIFYIQDGYNTSGQRLLGRQAAGEGFLKAFVQNSSNDSLYCYTSSRPEFTEFCQRIQPWIIGSRQIGWIPMTNHQALSQVGTLYHPDPMIDKIVWSRRFIDQRAYSVCGVTHTIASMVVMEKIAQLLITPVQPWDAMICTSIAVKTAIDRIFHTQAEYLAQRTGSKPNSLIQLPVIPLGVDCQAFNQGNNTANTRSSLRQELGIPPEDIVVLFVGRLCFYAKAHPVPMYMALEKAAKITQAKIHFVLAGWFENEQEEVNLKQSTKTFCPSVNCIFLDGRKPEIRFRIWSVADIFMSLVDNIQETFGLTPIEAMSAGLPTIVSDWDGYKETVRHEIDGFRIPTLIPPTESGLDLALAYFTNQFNYSSYIAHSSLSINVDIDAATKALILLINNPELRKKMGENGRQRANQTYNWPVIIKAYENLWQELADIRMTATMSTPLISNQPAIPWCDDPFRLFAHYSSSTANQNLMLGLGSMSNPHNLDQIRQNWMTNFGADRRISDQIIDKILATIAQAGSVSIANICQDHAEISPAELLRSLIYLIKFDVLKIQ